MTQRHHPVDAVDLQRIGLAVAFDVERDGDVRVVRVTADSPADVAGLQVGDRILRVDGQPVHSLAALWQSLWRGGVEREITLDIERDRQPNALKVYSVDRMVTLRHAEGI